MFSAQTVAGNVFVFSLTFTKPFGVFVISLSPSIPPPPPQQSEAVFGMRGCKFHCNNTISTYVFVILRGCWSLRGGVHLIINVILYLWNPIKNCAAKNRQQKFLIVFVLIIADEKSLVLIFFFNYLVLCWRSSQVYWTQALMFLIKPLAPCVSVMHKSLREGVVNIIIMVICTLHHLCLLNQLVRKILIAVIWNLNLDWFYFRINITGIYPLLYSALHH